MRSNREHKQVETTFLTTQTTFLTILTILTTFLTTQTTFLTVLTTFLTTQTGHLGRGRGGSSAHYLLTLAVVGGGKQALSQHAHLVGLFGRGGGL